VHQLSVESFPVGKLAGGERVSRNIGRARALKAERVGLVAEDCTQGAVDFFRAQASIIACRLLPLPEISTTMFFIQ
jgi:hypothetical protein